MNDIDHEELEHVNKALEEIDLDEFTEEFNEVDDELGNEVEDEICNEVEDALSNIYNRNHGGYRKHSRYKKLKK